MLRHLGIIKDKNMARPRKLKFGDGEIHLCGYSTEEATKIQQSLDLFFSGVASSQRGDPNAPGKETLFEEFSKIPVMGDIINLQNVEEVEIVDQTTLSETALDLYQDPTTKDYKIVHVKYNPVSKSAKVTEFIPAGSFRAAGTAALKMEMYKMGKV